MESSQRRQLLVSKGWVQGVLLVVLFGFFVLGLLAYRTYLAKPPTPKRVVDPQGTVLYTAADIHKGQQVFLHNGLMEWLRLPGDIVFIAGGAVPTLYVAYLGAVTDAAGHRAEGPLAARDS
jgi:nitric oxide reductase large subunit